MAFKGVFITLEGGEGAGKSTLLDYLADSLERAGRKVVKTREPGGSKLGEEIRHLLLNHDPAVQIGLQAELLLFLAARAQHIEELIRPALEAGHIILCDRYNDSTIAYQGAARNLDLDYVESLCNLVAGPVQPDFTLFLDVDPDIGLGRTKKITKAQALSGQFDRIEAEKLDFHERVRQAFHALASKHTNRIVLLDANHSQQNVFKLALDQVNNFLSNRSL